MFYVLAGLTERWSGWPRRVLESCAVRGVELGLAEPAKIDTPAPKSIKEASHHLQRFETCVRSELFAPRTSLSEQVREKQHVENQLWCLWPRSKRRQPNVLAKHKDWENLAGGFPLVSTWKAEEPKKLFMSYNNKIKWTCSACISLNMWL